jgi:hypothetical protein
VRIVIEFDAADGRATVTTEPHPQAEEVQPATAPGVFGAAVGMAVDAGPAPDAVGAGAGEHG